MRRRQVVLTLAILLAALAGPGRLSAQDTPAAAPAAGGAVAEKPFAYFSFMSDAQYGMGEKIALWIVLAIAVAGLAYAGALVGQVLGADQGTPKMRAVADAIRQGA